jgi:hypothetical protein
MADRRRVGALVDLESRATNTARFGSVFQGRRQITPADQEARARILTPARDMATVRRSLSGCGLAHGGEELGYVFFVGKGGKGAV